MTDGNRQRSRRFADSHVAAVVVAAAVAVATARLADRQHSTPAVADTMTVAVMVLAALA